MTDPQSVTFTIAQVDQVISGVNKNGPWTLWSVSASDGTKYRRFEDSYAARVGQTVTVQVEKRVKRGVSTGGLAAGEADWARMAHVLQFLSTGDTIEKSVMRAWEKYPKHETVSR